VRRVEHIMGMPVTIEVRGPGHHAAAVEAAFAWLRDVDVRFSLHRPDSELSRLNRGELALTDASLDVRAVLEECDRLRHATRGHFDVRAAYRHWSDGQPAAGLGVDPTGLVKGWAVQHAADTIAAGGARDFVVAVAGDLCARGRHTPAERWQVGIQHPLDPDAVAAVLEVEDLAVATSGAYARGRHIVDPYGTDPTASLLSVTVVGPDLGTADAYATAAFAMGASGPEWTLSLEPEYGALSVTVDGELLSTPLVAGLRRET
jgi:thiamine biosynthesis lipoprotein